MRRSRRSHVSRDEPFARVGILEFCLICSESFRGLVVDQLRCTCCGIEGLPGAGDVRCCLSLISCDAVFAIQGNSGAGKQSDRPFTSIGTFQGELTGPCSSSMGESTLNHI